MVLAESQGPSGHYVSVQASRGPISTGPRFCRVTSTQARQWQLLPDRGLFLSLHREAWVVGQHHMISFPSQWESRLWNLPGLPSQTYMPRMLSNHPASPCHPVPLVQLPCPCVSQGYHTRTRLTSPTLTESSNSGTE